MSTSNAPAESGASETFPPLPLEAWADTRETVHRFVQIVGKTRLVSMPHMNHWWHAALYVTPRGLTTSAIPHGDRTFAIDFDFVDHRLVISTSLGAVERFGLEGLSVAEFYMQVFSTLSRLGIDVAILAKPYDLPDRTPFADDTTHVAYDRDYVHRWWRILLQTDAVFKAFSGRFTGKSSPVHLFWHSFDLAVTRFSGRRAPDSPAADRVTREAYSHEVISFGFWPGDINLQAPAFYSYTAPLPDGLTDQPLRPSQAFWGQSRGSPMALLMYQELRTLDEPRAALLDFLESAYQAGASMAGWDQASFVTVDLGR